MGKKRQFQSCWILAQMPVLSALLWAAGWVSPHLPSSTCSAPMPLHDLLWLRWSPSLHPSSYRSPATTGRSWCSVMKSLHVPVVLGRLRFICHNPRVHWSLGTITGWSSSCLTSCLHSASSYALSSPPVSMTPPHLSSVPAKYHNLGQVFSKT